MIETTVPKSWYVKAIGERDQARAAVDTLVQAVAGQRAVRDWWTREAFRLAERAGWSSFGSHVDRPEVELEFDGQDEAGMPLWERPVQTVLADDLTATMRAYIDGLAELERKYGP